MEENKIPPIEIVKDPEYKVIYVNGVFGGVDPAEGRMIFYVDMVEPEMDENVPGKMRVGKIIRKLIIDVRMSPHQFITIAEWMNSHVRRLKEIMESEKPPE